MGCTRTNLAVGLRDISPLGAGVDGVLRVGHTGVLWFIVDNEPHAVSAVVCWVDAARGRCGVRFVLRTYEDQRRITRLCRRLAVDPFPQRG